MRWALSITLSAGVALSAAGAFAAPTPVVLRGATWKYLAGPSDPGTAWRDLAFDDGAWPAGAAPLGYGDPGMATTIPFGPSASSKWRTTYFRIAFEVAEDPAAILRLTLEASYDDGFVAYLNGTEVRRAAMPAGAVTYSTFATNHESGAYESFDVTASAGLLEAGTNVLAVEVHQATAGSSDLALDMALTFSTDSVNVTRGPYLQVATPTGITVRWRTDAPATSAVSYGPAPGAWEATVVEGTLVTEHEVALTGLAPGTSYAYTIGTAGATLAGDSTHVFRTAPPHGTHGPSRLWVIGDSGLGNQDARDVYAAYQARPEAAETGLWLMLGDNAYQSGTDAEYQAGVFDIYPELLRRSAVWPTRGNHDVLYAGPNNDYYDIFTLPTGGEAGGLASGTEAYYSFDHANVHYVCLDSEGSNRTLGGAMLQWLRADLAATAQPWIVAFWHHPAYTKGSHDSDDAGDSGGRMRDMRQNVLPILDSTGVDLVLTGHSHSYERSYLLNGHYGTSPTLTGAMVIDGGDGRAGGDGPYEKPTSGHGPFEGAVYTVAGSSAQISGGTLDHPVMVQSSNVLGSLVIEVDGQRMDLRFLDDAGAVRDSFTILKGGTLEAPPLLARKLHLSQARPNPSSGTTRIDYTLATAGPVRLTVMDVNGRRVATLVSAPRAAGAHSASWNGRGDAGHGVAPGVYYAVLEQNGEVRAVPLVRVE
jgi:hypothetical protein